MAEEEKEDSKDGGKGEKKGGSLVLIVIIVVLILLLVGGGLAAYFLLSSSDDAAVAVDEGSAQTTINEKKSTKNRKRDLTVVGPMVPMDKFIVNLQSENGGRFLKVSMNIELSDADLQTEIESKSPVIRNIIINALSSKTFEEISTIKGKDRLKDEIVNSINEILADGNVNNVYFTDFVIQ